MLLPGSGLLVVGLLSQVAANHTVQLLTGRSEIDLLLSFTRSSPLNRESEVDLFT